MKRTAGTYCNVSECIAIDRMKWPRRGQIAGVLLILAMLFLTAGCDVSTNARDNDYSDCIRNAKNATPQQCAEAAYRLHPEVR